MVILAKPDETLLEHTKNTLKVFKSIKNKYENVPKICGIPNFWEHLFYALFFHDFGKAATGFQKSLIDSDYSWNYRHEILSAGFITSLNEIIPSFYKKAIGLGIITHHKDVSYLREYNITTPEGIETYNKKLEELKPNFNELIAYLDLIPELSKKYLGYELKKPLKIKIKDLENVYRTTVLNYFLKWQDEEFTEMHGIYGLFLKGFINACDYLASGSKYEILSGIENINYIYNFESLRKIQKLASETKGSTFLIAPTGSGKTEASLFWADFNQNNTHSRRIFYILPYTASINAMYKRLKKDFDNDKVIGVLHGKSSYFLYKSLSNIDYSKSKEKVKEITNLTKKIYRPYKITTPFQIIKSFFGIKGFEMGLSEMANSLLILDEIHAYDVHTTSLLLEILKILKNKYDVDILIMSATLPTFLIKIFSDELNINNRISLNKKELDSFTRHEINLIPNTIEDNLYLIKKDLNSGKNVLIVCNTVKKAQKIFSCLKTESSALLHSKFILKDREKIEKNIDNLNLLVGTQSIEVSLNIDYDVLYSEPAPLDALIQRFGRINRKGWENNIIKPVNIFELGSEEDKYIYNIGTVEKTLKSLKNISILKESEIQKIIDEVYGNGYDSNDEKDFKKVKNAFNEFYKTIVPFINSKDNELAFYNMFKSYEVVPQKFKSEYMDKIEKKQYYEAISYCLSISAGQFKKQYSKNNIEIDKNTFFIDIPYDSKLGLILSEEEQTIL